MQPEDNGTGQIPVGFPHGEDIGEQPPRGIGRSLRRKVSMPSTVLITALDNGTLILQGRPDGPRVYLSQADAVSLRRELAQAFGSAEVIRSTAGD